MFQGCPPRALDYFQSNRSRDRSLRSCSHPHSKCHSLGRQTCSCGRIQGVSGSKLMLISESSRAHLRRHVLILFRNLDFLHIMDNILNKKLSSSRLQICKIWFLITSDEEGISRGNFFFC